MRVKKMKNKIVMEIVLVVLLAIVVAFCGCVEESPVPKEQLPEETIQYI